MRLIPRRRDRWWVADRRRGRSGRGRVRVATTIAAVLAVLGILLVGLVGGLGVRAGAGETTDAAPLVVAAPIDRQPRDVISPTFASGVLLVLVLSSSAATILLVRPPRRRGR
jgi:hypothetical protein